MAISVNWVTGVIFIPKSYMPIIQPVPEVRSLDVDLFRHDLKDLEASIEGMLYPRTHDHNTQVTISGVAYARAFVIIDPYTVEFEDDQYEVRPSGANHNLVDVRVQNQVSLTTQNSAGLQIVSGGGVAIADVQAGLTAQGYTVVRAPLLDNLDAAVTSVWDEPVAGHAAPGSFGELEAALASLMAQQIALVREMHRLKGLDPLNPLVNDDPGNRRRVPADGSLIDQTVVTVNGVTTVTRQ